MTFDPSLLLFVPGDRPDRFAKALASGASGIIVDLEDAVAADRKDAARAAVRAYLEAGGDLGAVAVRVNAPESAHGQADLEMLAGAPRPAAVVVPKAEDVGLLGHVSATCGNVPLIALVESPLGLLACETLARGANVLALAIGPYDLAAALGGEPDREAMLPHRARILVAARAAGRLALDGPAREYANPEICASDALHARRLGYDGKLLIHPLQIAPVRAAFAPTQDELARARRIVEAARTSSPAVLDGAMIDAPIVAAAERMLRRAPGISR